MWQTTWSEIWSRLAKHEAAPPDLLSEIYRELDEQVVSKKTAEELAAIGADPLVARMAFKRVKASAFPGERAVVEFMERAHVVCDDMGGDALSNAYFNLVSTFLLKYSLRYDLRRPFALCPTLTGMFSNLVRDLRLVTSQDAHLDALMKDFESSVRDLQSDCSDVRIKTCIQKQVNLLEGIGRGCPGVTGNTLGAICEQVSAATWPHAKVKDAIKNLYGFANDYPGIRHAGTPANALRTIETRDMVAVMILLAGFTPYLAHQLNADLVYRGS